MKTPLAQHDQRNKQSKLVIWQHDILTGGERHNKET